MPGVFATSGVVVLAWGYFLYQGVRDPLGGINSLWPLFGIANQLLAAIALCVGTTIFIKMHRARYMWITAVPLAVAGGGDALRPATRRFSRISRASAFWRKPAICRARWTPGPSRPARSARRRRQIFNDRLDAAVCGMFLIMVALILVDSMRVWLRILSGAREVKVDESPFVLSRLQTEEL